MTNAKDQFGVLEDGIVYLRPVDAADLPEDMVEEAGGADQLWSIHNSDGDQLAFIADLDMAQDLAKQFQYTALAVH